MIRGWDASHYDGLLTRAILARAAAEGIRFFSHKIAEGLADTEGTMDDTALAAARDAGIPILGGYLVPRSAPGVAAQVARWVQLADAGEPWWRTFPGWFWQVDLERWPYDNVPAAVGVDCAKALRAATGRTVILYASRSQYGDQLGAWDGPLWNADYRGGPSYPGDGWVSSGGQPAGWAPYSGRPPAILQYTSSATIAGLTTCDANAYRGTAADLAALIGGGDMQQTDKVMGSRSRDNTVGDVMADASNLRDEWYLGLDAHSGNPPVAGSRFDLLMQAVARILTPGVGDPGTMTDAQVADLAVRVAAVLAANVATAAQITDLSAQITALSAQVTDLQARLAAAALASHNAIA